jgi:hypothetical protein
MSGAWFSDNTLVKGDLAIGGKIFVFRTLRDAHNAYKTGSNITVSSYDPMLVLQTVSIELTTGTKANMVQVLTTGVFWVFETSLAFWSSSSAL